MKKHGNSKLWKEKMFQMWTKLVVTYADLKKSHSIKLLLKIIVMIFKSILSIVVWKIWFHFFPNF